MATYDGIFDFRSAYLNQGDYKSSSTATYPQEYISVYPSYDSSKPSQQVTMTYLGHDSANSGYEKFQLYIQNANASLSGNEKVTDVWIDCGKGYPYLTGRPIVSVNGNVITNNIVHLNLVSAALASTFNPAAQYLALGQSITVDFSFSPSNTSSIITEIGLNGNYKTHAIAVLIQNGNGYKTFGHYAVANPWNYYNMTSNVPKYQNSSGGWQACSLNASSCYVLPWVDPSTRSNRYRFGVTVSSTLPSGVDRKYRIGYKASDSNTSPFLEFTQDMDLYATTMPEVQIDAESTTNPYGANYLDPRTTACKTMLPFFAAPVFASATIPTISENGYRSGDPTVIRDRNMLILA